MSFSSPFVRRPIATSLLMAAVLLTGALAYVQLPVSPLPRVDFPTLQVNAALPGASPETMAATVATPLERRLGRIAGVTEITSTSTLGTTNLTLQFDLDRDVEAAARDVQAAINAAGGELPTNLPARPSYRKVNPADPPIMVLALTSATVSTGAMFEVANSVLAQKIMQVEGVGQVSLGGGQQPAVRVQADPEALAALNLSLADVRTTLARASVNQAKGGLQGATQGVVLDADDQLGDARRTAAVGVATRNGAVVRLGDVARVFDDVENNKVAAWCDGRRAILLTVRRQPGANIIATLERIRAKFTELRADLDADVQLSVALDRGQTIRAAVDDVETTLVITTVLVILVVFVFLGSVRATSIPTLAVPLSLLGTFALMWQLDYSLNNLTLMALTISTGFVVDDAIVVIENISRYLEQGMAPRQAARLGASQVEFTVLSITASLLAVFIPIFFMGGIVGRLFREFAVTLSLSIAVSAGVSLSVTPMMCAALLRPTHSQAGQGTGAIQRQLARLAAGYERGLRAALRHRRAMLALTMATVALTVGLFIGIPKGLFAQQDTGLIIGQTEAAQDISFAAMQTLQEEINRDLAAEPDVDHVVAFMGAGGGATTNTATVFMALKPRAQRTLGADAIIAKLRSKLSRHAGIGVYLQSAQDVRVGGRASRTQYQYTLQDANLATLRTWAPKVLAAFAELPQLRDVVSDQQTAALQLSVDIDRDRAARLGITAQQVDDALYDAYGQRFVSTAFTETGQTRTVLEVLPAYQRGPADVGRLFVRAPMLAGATGRGAAPVPLGAIVRMHTAPTPLAVNHQGQFVSVTLSFNLAPQVALGTAVEAIRAAELRVGMPASMRGGFAGTAQAFGDSTRNQPLLILAALVAVYLVLGILYESYLQPLTILSTLPSAGVGALLALWACQMDFGVIALIGIVLLIGIVKKNAIMMVDFALDLQREGALSAEEAIVQAAVLRFRPIMMTTLAAFLGALPLALGGGTGAELRRPLGVAIVGGLMVSQLLTLFTTPVVYLAVGRLGRRPTSGDGA